MIAGHFTASGKDPGEDARSACSPGCRACPALRGRWDEEEARSALFAGHPSTNLHPQFVVDPVPGEYRLVWPNGLRTYDDRRSPFGEPRPLDQRASNRFEVRVAAP